MATPSLSAPASIPEVEPLTAKRVAASFNPFRERAGLPLLVPNATSLCTSPQLRLIQSDPQTGTKCVCAYCFGIPLMELRMMFGVNSDHHPSFAGSIWDYWLQPQEDSWTRQSIARPGYYLLSLHGVFPKTMWSQQEDLIQSRFGAEWFRAPEHLAAEIFFACALNRIWEQPGIEFFWPWTNFFLHWGPSSNSLGRKIAVGFSHRFVELRDYDPQRADLHFLATMLARRFGVAAA